MKMVIDIPNFAWIEDIKDFKSAVKEYNKGSAFDHAIREALLLGTPLPEHHGDLIDRNELLDESYQIDSMYCEYDEVVNVDDIKDAPTIIEGSDSK